MSIMKKKIFKDFQFSNQSEAMVAILDVRQGQWKKPTWAFFPGELKIKIRKFYGVMIKKKLFMFEYMHILSIIVKPLNNLPYTIFFISAISGTQNSILQYTMCLQGKHYFMK
jgi:hypothetical protein